MIPPLPSLRTYRETKNGLSITHFHVPSGCRRATSAVIISGPSCADVSAISPATIDGCCPSAENVYPPASIAITPSRIASDPSERCPGWNNTTPSGS